MIYDTLFAGVVSGKIGIHKSTSNLQALDIVFGCWEMAEDRPRWKNKFT